MELVRVLSESKLIDLATERGLPKEHDGEEILLMMLNPDQDSEPGFRGINLWREGDEKQKVELHIQDLKNVFLEILTHADVGESDLFLHAAKQRRLGCCGW